MSTTLELFWNLSSSKKKERLDAAAKLVTTLHRFQSEFAPAEVSDGEETSDSAQVDTLDTLNAQDVSYSIRRLIRGLASPRESSRLGFAVSLTEVRPIVSAFVLFTESLCVKLLSRLDTVTCGQIMTLVLDASKTQGSMTGQEERDNYFARLFGITSIIHSGLIARTGTLPTSSTSASSPESYELVISTLIALGEKKSWLRESAWWALVSAVEALDKSDVEWKEQGIGALLDTIYAKGSGWTPEKIALTLRLQALFPKRNWNSVLSPAFKGTDILATQNLRVVANVLKVCPNVCPHHPTASIFYRNLEPQRKTPSRTRPLGRGNPSYTLSGPSSLIHCYLKTKEPLLRVPSKTFGI
jgi:DNA polymerase phi